MPRVGVSGARIVRAQRGARLALAIAFAAAATGLAAVTGVAGTGAAGGEPAPASFRLENGSVGCRLLSAEELACRADGAETAVVLDASGGSSASDVDVDWDETTPVLLQAQSWWNGAFACGVEDDAVTCTAGDGAATASAGGLGGVR
jgi:hypothetical protein